jgi:LSD1 subclass zinc finger protein
MPDQILVCPSCRTSLKPSKPVPPGARLKCPKCQTAFAAPAAPAPAPAEELEVLEELSPAPPPSRRPAAGAKPPRPYDRPAAKPGRADERTAPRPAPEGRRGDPDDVLDVEEADDAGPAGGGAGPKKKGVPTWVWLAGGGVGLLLLCGCGGGVTALVMGMGSNVSKASYDKITKDTTEDDLKKLLGAPSLSGDAAAKQLGVPLPKDQNVLVWKSGDDFISVSTVKGKAVAKSCKIGPLTQTEVLAFDLGGGSGGPKGGSRP